MNLRNPSSIKFLFYVLLGFVLTSSSPASNGFGDHINWVDYTSAISDSSKPTMVILHKSWCAACKNLKPKLAESLDFEELSKEFSMVNAGESEELHDNADLSLDGSYIPRIYFLDPQGPVLPGFYNSKGNPSYKFFYFNADTVLSSMRQVLEDFPEAKEEL